MRNAHYVQAADAGLLESAARFGTRLPRSVPGLPASDSVFPPVTVPAKPIVG